MVEMAIWPFYTEPILPIRKVRKLRRVPETTGAPLNFKDLILVLFFNLASGYESMNVYLF